MSWSCPHCEKSFRRKDSMKRHINNRHSNPGHFTPFKGTSVLLHCLLHPNFVIYFELGAFVVNKCIFYSFQISVYFNHFANKNNNQEICSSKNIH